MNCISCKQPLMDDADYCHRCGAKVLKSRLSTYQLLNDLIENIFNWDNHFYRTLKHLILKPHVVMESYVSGVRKVYFNPLSFMLVYVAFVLFVAQFIPDVMSGDFLEGFIEGYTNSDNETVSERPKSKLVQLYFQYYNLAIITLIPISAFISYTVFIDMGHNYAEHNVFSMYLIPISGLLTLLITAVGNSLSFFEASDFYDFRMIFMYLFFNYGFIRLYQLDFRSVVLANVKAVFLLVGLLLLVSMGIALLASMPELI